MAAPEPPPASPLARSLTGTCGRRGGEAEAAGSPAVTHRSPGTASWRAARARSASRSPPAEGCCPGRRCAAGRAAASWRSSRPPSARPGRHFPPRHLPRPLPRPRPPPPRGREEVPEEAGVSSRPSPTQWRRGGGEGGTEGAGREGGRPQKLGPRRQGRSR